MYEHKNSLCFSPWPQRLTINQSSRPSKHSNVFCDLSFRFACDFATEVSDVGSSGARTQSAGVLGGVHSVPTPASTNVDSVVNGSVQYNVARQKKVCQMEELDGTVVRREAAVLGSIKT